jgi:hypothetical protein
MKKAESPEYALLISADQRWKRASAAISDYGLSVASPRITEITNKCQRLVAKGHRYPPPHILRKVAGRYVATCEEVEKELRDHLKRFLTRTRNRANRVPLCSHLADEQLFLATCFEELEGYIERGRYLAESRNVFSLMRRIKRQIESIQWRHINRPCSCFTRAA